MGNSKLYNLDSVRVKKESFVTSKLQANALFNFTDDLRWLIKSIKQKMLSPRYCIEDIKYLKIKGLKKIALPMKCFCDINIHRLKEHLEFYGFYGIAFAKKWAMKQKIQPVQYVNPESDLCKDFKHVMYSSIKNKNQKSCKLEKDLKNYMLLHLMYLKPYSCKVNRRTDEKLIDKCLTDECEWRFVPDVTKLECPQVIYDEAILNGNLIDFSNALDGVSEVSLNFEYSDIKYILVRSHNDLKALTKEILALNNIEDMERYELISKIIIWDNAKEDF